VIRRLTLADSVPLREIRREALEREPFAFGSSPGEDFAQSLEQVHSLLTDAQTAVFGAFEPDLVGIVGIRRLTRKKTRHKARIWGMYLRDEHRGRGLGRQLMESAIAFAREQDGVRLLQLAVTERAATAAALYEKLGFVVWGIEPAGLHVEGTDLAEKHMVLKL
jgi:ribosomal protein S18 acetylase RimI-like enzyme